MSDWEHITIPISAGESPNTEEVGRRGVEEVLNLIPRKSGGLRTRPVFSVDSEGYFVTADNGVPTSGTTYPLLANLPFNPRALTKLRAGGGEVPALLADGRAFVQYTNQAWQDLGSFWSARLTDYGFSARDVDLATGSAFPRRAGVASDSDETVMLSVYNGVHGSDGQLIAGVIPTTVLPNTHVCPVAYGDFPGFVFNTSAGELRLLYVVPSSPHTPIEILVATDARTTPGQYQWASYVPATNHVVISYVTTTVGQVKTVLVDISNDTVGAPVSLTNANQVENVANAFIDNRIVVAYSESAGTLDVKTRVYSTALVNQAIDVTFASTYVAYQLTVGPGTTNNAVVAWGTADGAGADSSVHIGTRSTTAATGGTIRKSFLGGGGISRYSLQYAPWRQSTPTGNFRVLMGIAHATTVTSINNLNNTWAIIDVTVPEDDNHDQAAMVAQGPALGTALQYVTPVDLRYNGNVLLTSLDYTSFDASGGIQGGLRMLKFSLDHQIPVAEANGVWYLGGSVTHAYDGQFMYDAGFWSVPGVSVAAAAGGSVTAGTYAVAAVWAWTDGQGRRHRSAVSNIVNGVTAAGNLTLQVTFTNMMVHRKIRAQIEIYVSEINPPASGFFPMYLAATRENSTSNATSTFSITSVATLDTNEILYTTGGVLDNFPPPGSDGGLAAAGDRLWTATGRRLAASKLLDLPNVTPGWSEDLEVTIPASGGTIRALAPEGDGVLVFCEHSTYYVGGEGYDDLLRGSGFSSPSLVADVGANGAKSLVRTPQGIVFQSFDNRVHVLANGSKHISWGVDTELITSRVHMVHWPELEVVLMFPENQDDAARLVAVLHYKTGQWFRWSFVGEENNAPNSGDVIDGVPWTLSTGVRQVGYLAFQSGGDIYGESGDPYDITQRIRLSWIRLDEDRARGWARLGAVNVMGVAEGAGTMTVQIDRDYVVLAAPETATRTLAPVPGSPGTTWPTQRMAPEIRTARMKASAVRLSLTFNSSVVVSEVELDVRRAAPRAPSGNRS